jgi:hypothetical protein
VCGAPDDELREMNWVVDHRGEGPSGAAVYISVLGARRGEMERRPRYPRFMKGDRVEVVIAADDGSRTYEITATRAGRRVEVSTVRGVVEVTEVTRTGEPVRRGRFMASRVLALVEHPASEARDRGAAGEETS